MTRQPEPRKRIIDSTPAPSPPAHRAGVMAPRWPRRRSDAYVCCPTRRSLPYRKPFPNQGDTSGRTASDDVGWRQRRLRLKNHATGRRSTCPYPATINTEGMVSRHIRWKPLMLVPPAWQVLIHLHCLVVELASAQSTPKERWSILLPAAKGSVGGRGAPQPCATIDGATQHPVSTALVSGCGSGPREAAPRRLEPAASSSSSTPRDALNHAWNDRTGYGS